MRSALGADEIFSGVVAAIYIPSVDRDGAAVDQEAWKDEAMTLFARLFGGASAIQLDGVWLDQERDSLVSDEPFLVYSHTLAGAVDPAKLADIGAFARRLLVGTKQGEVGIVIGPGYYAIRPPKEDTDGRDDS